MYVLLAKYYTFVLASVGRSITEHLKYKSVTYKDSKIMTRKVANNQTSDVNQCSRNFPGKRTKIIMLNLEQ